MERNKRIRRQGGGRKPIVALQNGTPIHVDGVAGVVQVVDACTFAVVIAGSVTLNVKIDVAQEALEARAQDQFEEMQKQLVKWQERAAYHVKELARLEEQYPRWIEHAPHLAGQEMGHIKSRRFYLQQAQQRVDELRRALQETK